MSEPNTPELDKLTDVQNLWDVYREVRRAKGIDIEKLFTKFAANEASKLGFPGARQDFHELCEAGCTPELLAAIIALFRFHGYIERFWAGIVGGPYHREKVTRILEKAALSLEKTFAVVLEAEDEKVREAFAHSGRIPMSQLISELRFYTGFLNMAEELAADVEVRSILELAKYILTSYVKRATGRFQDRNVSAVLAEMVGDSKFNEVAQRMWRHRNYSRLDKHFSQLTDLLFTFDTALACRR